MTAELRPRFIASLFAVGVSLAAAHASAAGFAVADQGPAASGIANAATARVDLAEAAFYNPSAYALFPGARLALGTAFVSPDLVHASPSTGVATGAQTETTVVPAFHAAYTFEDPRVAISVYSGVPFGSGISWDDQWTGRFEVTNLSLRVFETGLNVAYAHDFGGAILAVGAGPRFLASNVELARKVDGVDTEGSVRVVGDTTSVSGQASLSLVTLYGNIAMSYRPRVTLDYAGEADFEDIPVELASRARDQDVTTSVTLPDRLATGIALNAFGLATLSVDVELFLWSTFDDFGIDFSAEETPDVSQPRNWSDTVALRAGLESSFTDLYGLNVRAGFAWDPTPSPSDTLSPTSPDSDRYVFSSGLAWRSTFGLGADLAVSYIHLTETRATGEEAFPGDYSGSALLVNVGANYRF